MIIILYYFILPTTSILPSSDTCFEQGNYVFCPPTKSCIDSGNCIDCPNGLHVENIDRHVCENRSIFSKLPVDVIGIFVWFFSAGLAISAGVGGGGIFVPLGILLLRFEAKAASGLSQASIFGSSLAGFLININKKHPHTNRPLIDLNIALFLAPMEMAGALLGVIIQKPLPDWLILLLFAIILGYTALRTFIKGISIYKKEKEQISIVNHASHEETSNTESTTNSENNEINAISISNESVMFNRKQEQVNRLVQRESIQYPKDKYFNLFIVWIILVVLILIKGGKGVDSIIPSIDYCDPFYWSLYMLSFIWLLSFGLYMGNVVVGISQLKSSINYPIVNGDVIWNKVNVLTYMCYTFIAGIIAGVIGIGGGMVLGPIMLQLGVLPQVSSATTATMILLTSSIAAGLFIIGGVIPLDYALVYFSSAFIGALLGKLFIDYQVKKRKLSSILIFLLALIITIATIMVTVTGIVKYSSNNWQFEGFSSIC